MSKNEQNFSLKSLFVPLTTFKAIHLIIAVGLIVFCNMLFNNFVWDDFNYIVSDPGIQNTNIIQLFGNTNNFNNSGFYRPVTAFYYSILINLFGKQPFYYHIIQLILHISNTCLLFLVFKNFFNKTPSFILSLLFLVHPIQVESVSYIASTQSELFFLFGVITLLISLKEVVDSRHIILIFLLLLFSLLIYEAGILFLCVIVLYQVLNNRKKKLSYLLLIPAILGCYFLIRFVLFHITGKSNLSLLANLSIPDRAIHIPSIIFYYIKTLFYPSKLAINQLWVIEEINFRNFYFPLCIDLLFFALLALSGFYVYRNNRRLFKTFLFFFLWFISGLVILLQLYPLDMTVADRWFYFPITGLLGVFGTVAASVHLPNMRYKTIGYASITFILIVLSCRTIIRNTDWQDPITLYSHDARIEENFNLEYNLGAHLANAHRYHEALPHIKRSLELFPQDTKAYNLEFLYEHEYVPSLYYLGYLYDQVGDAENAIIYYKKAVAHDKLDNDMKNTAYKRLAKIQTTQNNSEYERIGVEK